MNFFDQINSHNFLFLDKLIEANDLELVLLVNEGRIDENIEHNLNEILENAPSLKFNPVISDEKCRKYKIVFNECLAYSVRNETFTIWNNDEKFVGNLLRKYSRSKFLDYLDISTNIDYAKNFMDVKEYFHFGICCENQIIDVAVSEEPLIEQL